MGKGQVNTESHAIFDNIDFATDTSDDFINYFFVAHTSKSQTLC